MPESDELVPRVGLPISDAAWDAGATGWEPISKAFIRRELVRPYPDYRSLADRLAGYSAAERHAAWIGIAQEAPTRMGRTRAYLEALHNDPDSTSVAWGWLDGDFDLGGNVEHVVGPGDPRTLATVEALRRRLGSILDIGGNDLYRDAAMPVVASVGQGATQTAAKGASAVKAASVRAKPVVARAARARVKPAEEKPSAARAQPVVAGAVEAEVLPVDADFLAGQMQSSGAPAPLAQMIAQPPDSQTWWPTHVVPPGGLPAWDYPDPSRQPIVVLDGGLGLVVDGIAGDWALVRAVNGWQGWVDGRLLGWWA